MAILKTGFDRLVFATLFMTCPIVITALAHQFQESVEKTIERRLFTNEPFEFDHLALKNFKIAPSESYHYWAASMLRYKVSPKSVDEIGDGTYENWLENLSFTIKNKSDKRMTYIGLELQFPDTEANGPEMVYTQLGFGAPLYASRERLKSDLRFALGAEDEITFVLSAERLNSIKEFLALRKFRLADLNKIVIKVGEIHFADGLKWEQGYYYKPNLNAVGGYERITQ